MRAGRNRRPRLIQEVLDGHEMSIKSLAANMGLSYSVVLETIRGIRNNRKVLRRLLELGAQPEYIVEAAGSLELKRAGPATWCKRKSSS